MKKFFSEISKIIKKYKLHVLKDVMIFIVITLVVHFSYRYWARSTAYWPIKEIMVSSHEFMTDMVFRQSVWIIDNILTIPFTISDRTFHFQNNGFITINHGCSGLKPMLQYFLLMLIFPGPWRHKAWFIPMGLIIVHFTNLFRISGLAVVTITIPEYWDFAHDNLFRPFFYVVIFSLWVWWVEKFRAKSMGHRA